MHYVNNLPVVGLKMIKLMNSQLAEIYGIEKYPQLLYFRDSIPILFHGEFTHTL